MFSISRELNYLKSGKLLKKLLTSRERDGQRFAEQLGYTKDEKQHFSMDSFLGQGSEAISQIRGAWIIREGLRARVSHGVARPGFADVQPPRDTAMALVLL